MSMTVAYRADTGGMGLIPSQSENKFMVATGPIWSKEKSEGLILQEELLL